MYHEITASSLVKISLDGKVLDAGTTKLGINRAGYVLHSAIHGARPDVQCVLHMHTAVVSAVSSMKCGLLPICQEAMIIGPIAYHDYQGIVSDEEERESIVRDLGDKNVSNVFLSLIKDSFFLYLCDAYCLFLVLLLSVTFR